MFVRRRKRKRKMVRNCCGGGGDTLLIGTLIELSLAVPITNSLAFLFTVLGEWWAEGKVISRGQFFTSLPFSPRKYLMTARRYLDRYGVRDGRHRALRTVKALMIGLCICSIPLCTKLKGV